MDSMKHTHEVPGTQNPLGKAPQSSSLPSQEDGALGQGAIESGQGGEESCFLGQPPTPSFLASAGSSPQAYSPAALVSAPRSHRGCRPRRTAASLGQAPAPGTVPLSCLSDLPLVPANSQGAWVPWPGHLPSISPHGR